MYKRQAIDYVCGARTEEVADRILSICENYPKPALDCAMNFLSTHDTERAITAIADEPANGRDRFWQSGRRIPAARMEDAIRRLLLAYALVYTCLLYTAMHMAPWMNTSTSMGLALTTARISSKESSRARMTRS